MRLCRFTTILLVLMFCLPLSSYAAWRYIAPMPHGRYYHDATLGKDGKIYVMGGIVFKVTKTDILRKYNNGEYSTLVYDPKIDKWKYLDPVPGNIIPYKFIIYNEAKSEWEYKKKVVVRKKGVGEREFVVPDEYKNFSGKIRHTDFDRQGNGVALITNQDGLIWWIGGKSFGDWAEDIVLTYDPVFDAWTKVTYWEEKTGPGYKYHPVFHTKIPRMHEQRVFHDAVITPDGRIYVIGGGRIEKRKGPSGPINEDVYSNTVECYDPQTNKWEYKAPFKTTIAGGTAVVMPDDKIYMFGGTNGKAGKVLDIVEVYDPKTNTWSSRKPMPEPRYGHAAVLGSDDKIYVMGGTKIEYGPPLRDVFIYDPKKDTWRKGPKMQRPRAALSAVSTPDGRIYAIGGTDKGAYDTEETINFFLPKKHEVYTGKVQDTVEVLDLNEH